MKTTSNSLRKTYSGIFGNQVVLQNRNGKSIMTMPPVKPPKEPTEKQLAVRREFQLAANYGKKMLQDPALLAAYTAKACNGMSPYRLAVKDYLNPPFVSRIDSSGYKGNPGDKISVTAGDDFELAEVTVQIVDPAGTVIEQGVCAFSLPSGNWDYAATMQVTDLAGVTITAKARDLPRHTAELSITL